MALTKTDRRKRIKLRISKLVTGTPDVPRLSVFRSNKQIYAQIIDDKIGKTVIAASSRSKELAAFKGNKMDQAKEVGKLLATKAIEGGVTAVVFDRNGYLYHGRIKSLADAARECGLKF